MKISKICKICFLVINFFFDSYYFFSTFFSLKTTFCYFLTINSRLRCLKYIFLLLIVKFNKLICFRIYKKQFESVQEIDWNEIGNYFDGFTIPFLSRTFRTLFDAAVKKLETPKFFGTSIIFPIHLFQLCTIKNVVL